NIIEEAKNKNQYVDITREKKSKSIIITKNFFIYKAFVYSNALIDRINKIKITSFLDMNGTYVKLNSIETLISYSNSARLKKIIKKANEDKRIIDLTGKNNRKSVILTKDNFVVLSEVDIRTLKNRI
ncbi:MAG: extracellular matrix/biofilm biosynthesis regulator RemA family protein, partial [archaeon]